jgi:hypothetical protein
MPRRPELLDVVALTVPRGDRPAGTVATVVEELGGGWVMVEFRDGEDWTERIVDVPIDALAVLERPARSQG